VYGDLKEMKPEDAPEPLENFGTMSHYVDANRMHAIMTGISVTGMLHLGPFLTRGFLWSYGRVHFIPVRSN
jgi:hypothetical protein